VGAGSQWQRVDHQLCRGAVGLFATQNHNVLRVLAERLDALDLIVKDSGDKEARRKLRQLAEQWFAPQLEQPWALRPLAGEPQNDTQRRAICIGTLASMARVASVIRNRRAACRRRSRPIPVRSIPTWPDRLSPLPPSLVTRPATIAGSRPFKRARPPTRRRKKSPAIYTRCRNSVCPALPDRTLNLIIQGTIPQEAVAAILSQLLSFRHSQQAGVGVPKAALAELRERFGDMGVSRVVESLGRLMGSYRNDVVSFFEQNKPAGAERALQRALERMDQAEQLRQRVTKDLLDYLVAL
jgi:hypothetical protein